MRCAIWYHLYNLKNVKTPMEALACNLLKVTPLHGSFSRFLNFTNGTKSRNPSHMKRATRISGGCQIYPLNACFSLKIKHT